MVMEVVMTVEVEVVMLAKVVGLLALCLILMGVLPEFSTGHNVCCSFLVNILFQAKEIPFYS